MKCRQCGNEIADKAIVCYRCGTATTEAKFKAPPARKPRRSSSNLVFTVLAVALVATLVLYIGRFATGEAADIARWLVIVLAVAIVAMRLIARRSRH
jgi:hypothetical protein